MKSLQTLGWGLYLTCSWTWCIGMFLPVVMLQRYGWAGFWIFLIPNVIGCAGFGYVFRNAEASLDFVRRHRIKLVAFSLVTIVFHVYFLAMLLRLHGAPLIAVVALPLLLLLPSLLLPPAGSRVWLCLALLLWLLSMACGLSLLPLEQGATPQRPVTEALFLVPVVIFGFLLCPCLDLTFHRALQESPSRHAFAVFGLSFIPVIGITLLYSQKILANIPLIVSVHLVLQALFTVTAHAGELRRLYSAMDMRRVWRWLAGVSAVMALGVSVPLLSASFLLDSYLRFFVFYGFLFPVWLVSARMAVRPGLVPVLFVLLSLPMLEAGFIWHNTWLTVVPLLVLGVGICFFGRQPAFSGTLQTPENPR